MSSVPTLNKFSQKSDGLGVHSCVGTGLEVIDSAQSVDSAESWIQSLHCQCPSQSKAENLVKLSF